MGSYGMTTLTPPGRIVMASADGAPEWKTGGITVEWGVVTAVGSDTVLADGITVKAGDKYLRYGQVMARITNAGTVTVTGTPTGGTFTLTVTSQRTGVAATTATIAYNAAASAVQTALTALANVGAGNATVTGSAGGPYTVTFADSLGSMTVALGTNSLTGGTAPSVTVTAGGISGTSAGKYGPADTSASDGRQTLAEGSTFIVNSTVIQSNLGSDHPAVFDGGKIFPDRLIVGGANQPTLASVKSALPRLKSVTD